MIFEVPSGAKGWLVIFHRHSTWWVEKVCPGRFKHVSLAGFVPGPDVWLVVSWELARLRVGVVKDADIDEWLPRWAGPEAGVLRVKAPDFDFGTYRPRLTLSCSSVTAHVLGIRRGALLPIGLWHQLIAEGAEIVSDATQSLHPSTDGGREGCSGGSRARAA